MAEENIRVQNFGYQLAAERFSDVMWAMQQILFMGIDKRLAIFLWDESLKAGSSRIYMTQERIASYIGSAREVVTRILKYFSDEGIIESFRGGIEIKDKEKLKKLALWEKKGLIQAYKEFLDDYKTAGGQIIQFDDCLWELFDESNPASFFAEGNASLADLADEFVAINNEVVDYAHELGLTVWTHNCRSNDRDRKSVV